MHNLLRTLVYDGQVSLTVADTTDIVKECVRLHCLSRDSAFVFGKTLSAMVFMSACLKNERGEISLALKTDGTCGDIGISGNRALHLRGYMLNTQAQGEESSVLGANGALTIIRDDGYNMPFVGSCALKDGSVDASFEEYFAISEQLPTRICTTIKYTADGEIEFCGVAVLQPLPFADEATLHAVQNVALDELLAQTQAHGINQAVRAQFQTDERVWEERTARYQCNCSRDYVSRVLVSLGEAQTREIIQEEGAVRVHCHYCNTDYEFDGEDADRMFNKI